MTNTDGVYFSFLFRLFCPQNGQKLLFSHFTQGLCGDYARGLFAGGISRISSMPWEMRRFSFVFDTLGICRISKFSGSSGKWTFLKRPHFPKDRPLVRSPATGSRGEHRVSAIAPHGTTLQTLGLWQQTAGATPASYEFALSK